MLYDESWLNKNGMIRINLVSPVDRDEFLELYMYRVHLQPNQ